MNSIVDACLKSINDINENEFIAEMNTFDALLENYNKMLCLMEYDTSRVFVEAEVAQNPPAQNTQPAAQPAQAGNTQQQTATTKTDNGEKKSAWEFNPRPDKKDGSGKENIIISILAFIPRLIAACVKFLVNSIKNLFSGKDKTEQAMNNVTKQLDAAPDAFRKWALDQDNLARLMEEASGQQNWSLHYRISPIKFDNSAKVATGEKGFLGMNKYEIRVYPPIGTDTIENNLKSYVTEVLDPLIKDLNALFVHKTNDQNGQKIMQLTGDTVKNLKGIINAFYMKLKKQNEIAMNVKKTQDSTKKLIVQIPEKPNLTTMDYSKTPKELYTKLGEFSQILQVIEKRSDTIEKLVQNYQKDPGTMAPDSPETLTAFKKTIEELKDVTSDIIRQMRFVSDLATNLPKELDLTAQGIPKLIQRWTQNNGDTTEANAEKPTEGGEVNNDAAAENSDSPTNTNNIPDEAYNALDEQNRRQAIPEAAKGVGNAIVGAAKKAGNTVSNWGSKVKKFISKNPNAIHVVRVKDPTGMDPKFGVARRIEIPEKSIPEFTKKWKDQGFEVTILESSNLIGIDEDGNQYEITLEEYIENYSDIEIITEQDYLMYYQFENISSLEF